MPSKNSKYFMLNPEGKHHTNKGRGLWLHFPETCNIYEEKQSILYRSDAPQKTSFGQPTEIRTIPTAKGFVVVLYFDNGLSSHMVFIAHLGSKHGAWQNIPWEPAFQHKWGKSDQTISDAIDNFLRVAECEMTRKVLPKG